VSLLERLSLTCLLECYFSKITVTSADDNCGVGVDQESSPTTLLTWWQRQVAAATVAAAVFASCAHVTAVLASSIMISDEIDQSCTFCIVHGQAMHLLMCASVLHVLAVCALRTAIQAF
jgi:hypothetical protein